MVMPDALPIPVPSFTLSMKPFGNVKR